MTSSSDARPGRNQPCHCGSGKKYKQCCLAKDEAEAAAAARAKAAEEAAAIAETADSRGRVRGRLDRDVTRQPSADAPAVEVGVHPRVRSPGNGCRARSAAASPVAGH